MKNQISTKNYYSWYCILS